MMRGLQPDLSGVPSAPIRGHGGLAWGILGALQILALCSFILPVFHPEWSGRHDVPFVEKALSTVFLTFLAALPVFSLVCFLFGATKPATAAIRFFSAITLLLVILMPMDL